MYKQSRSKRWIGVLREALAMLKMAEKSVATYAEAATRMQGVRVISERDKDVMTSIARDNIKLTLRSQNLGGESHLADALTPIVNALGNFSLGAQFNTTLRALIDSIEDALPLLEEQIAEEATIDEIIGELERALLISLVVTLTSHNVLIQKVEEWERSHQRSLQGLEPTDVGHYLDVKTLMYVDKSGPGRVHMQDLVSSINGGAVIWMAGAGRETVESYPEAQAVAYAQWSVTRSRCGRSSSAEGSPLGSISRPLSASEAATSATTTSEISALSAMTSFTTRASAKTPHNSSGSNGD